METEATVVGEEGVGEGEVQASLGLTRQPWVGAAGDFGIHSRLSEGRFLSKTSFKHGPIYHIELMRRAWKASW